MTEQLKSSINKPYYISYFMNPYFLMLTKSVFSPMNVFAYVPLTDSKIRFIYMFIIIYSF
jgi:hypothetical protein